MRTTCLSRRSRFRTFGNGRFHRDVLRSVGKLSTQPRFLFSPPDPRLMSVKDATEMIAFGSRFFTRSPTLVARYEICVRLPNHSRIPLPLRQLLRFLLTVIKTESYSDGTSSSNHQRWRGKLRQDNWIRGRHGSL